MSDEALLRKLNRLAKWRSIFAGWQLGTRPREDPECQAVRDHREVTMLLRAEVTALTKLLLDRKVFTLEELQGEIGAEADLLSKDYEKAFPGLRASDAGIEVFDLELVKKTMKGWRP